MHRRVNQVTTVPMSNDSRSVTMKAVGEEAPSKAGTPAPATTGELLTTMRPISGSGAPASRPPPQSQTSFPSCFLRSRTRASGSPGTTVPSGAAAGSSVLDTTYWRRCA